jgi:short-subunit dehydrogenase involved in D-alanine esterification of teichoic acids
MVNVLVNNAGIMRAEAEGRADATLDMLNGTAG